MTLTEILLSAILAIMVDYWLTFTGFRRGVRIAISDTKKMAGRIVTKIKGMFA